MKFIKTLFNKKTSKYSTVTEEINQDDSQVGLEQEELNSQDIPENEDREYEVVEIEILPQKIICPDCGGITLEGLDFCDKCGGEL